MFFVLLVNRDVGQTMAAQDLHGSKREDEGWKSCQPNEVHALEFLLPINGITYVHLQEKVGQPTCLNGIAPCPAINEIRRVDGHETGVGV